VEAFLPKVSAPPLTEIDHPGVAAVCLGNRTAQYGISYKSVFSGGRKEAFNVALFEPEKANYLDSCMSCVTGVQVSVGEPYGYGWMPEDCPKGFTEAWKSPDDGEVDGSA
jgi:hypothetical protein